MAGAEEPKPLGCCGRMLVCLGLKAKPAREVSVVELTEQGEQKPELKKEQLWGSWNFTWQELESGKLREGVVRFYPGGGTSIDIYQGKFAREWKFDTIEDWFVGDIEDVGHIEAQIDLKGETASGYGTLNNGELTLWRSWEYEDAWSYIVGTWDLYSKMDPDALNSYHFRKMSDPDKPAPDIEVVINEDWRGSLAYANGCMSKEDWEMEIDAHIMSAVLGPGFGKLKMEFARDGTVGLADMHGSHFEVVRRADAEGEAW
mmetsp:Transcript_11387/g.28732  ORF Transcript_11387/g.28732 Transcript_11387/m.28732 type:complete len:259 (+) Transcript_11387:69-845(+)